MSRFEFSLRECGTRDEKELVQLAQATFLESYCHETSPADLLAYNQRLVENQVVLGWLTPGQGCRVWGAALEPLGSLIGYLTLTPPNLPLPDLGSRDLEVRKIYVLHRFQGHRLGERLMAQAIDEARLMGAPRLVLSVYSENHRALAFYRKMGFSLAGTRPFQVGSRLYDDAILAMKL